MRSEQILRDYYSGKLAQQIEMRKLELAYPPRPENEVKIRVSESSVGDPTEREVLNRVMDLRLATLERRLMCVEKFLRECEQVDQDILRLRYQREFQWVKVAMEVNYSRRTCIRRHNNLLIELRKYLAWER